MFNYEKKQNLYNHNEGQWTERFSDSDFALRLGIKNWGEKIKSYGKTLYSNNSFAYDDEAIYLVDKLEITFSSNEYYSFLTNENIISIGNIRLVKESGKERYFYHQYKIYVEDDVFGYLNLHSTAKYSIHKIEVTNETLYVQDSIFILDTMLKIAKHFDFTFSNVTKYELARDTDVNYYDQFCNIYYQSDFCPRQIHEIHQTQPKYAFHGKRKMVMHQTDAKDTSYGTFKIGSKDSDSQIKLYCKSHELKTWKQEKSYINEVHRNYFKNSEVICRVEAIANSKAFNKRELDLLDLLLPEKHPRVFQSLIGDKLKFKYLTEYQWDNNNNKKFCVFELIDPSYYTKGNIESMAVKKNVTTHNNQYNKFKILVNEYLDGEIGLSGVIGFMQRNIWHGKASKSKYLEELSKSIKNNGGISRKKKKKEKLLPQLLFSDGQYWQLCKIWFKAMIKK